MPTYLRKKRTSADDLAAIKTFVLRRNKDWQIIDKNLKRIAKLYARYDEAVKRPYLHLSRRQLNEPLKEALSFLYNSKATCFSHIKTYRNKANERLGCCPYCGLPGNITLDHYLPEALKAFPEYASLTDNLLPACHACQGKKRAYFSRKTHVRTVTRRRNVLTTPKGKPVSPRHKRGVLQAKSSPVTYEPIRLLHPFFDDFIERAVLGVVLDGHNSYKVIAKGRLERWQRMCVTFHVAELGISDRASEPVCRLKQAFASDLYKVGARSEAKIRAELPRLLDSALRRTVYASNSIEVAYARSLAQDPALLQDLLNEVNQPSPKNKVAHRGYLI